MVLSSVTTAFSTPSTSPVIITFGDSSEVQLSTQTLVKNLPTATVMKYSDINSLVSANILMRSSSPIILVGHGSKQGIIGPNGKIISWNKIGKWINSLPATKVFLLSCDSSYGIKYIKTKSLGFNGVIDGIAEAYVVDAMISRSSSQSVFKVLLQDAISRVEKIYSGKASWVPLESVPVSYIYEKNFVASSNDPVAYAAAANSAIGTMHYDVWNIWEPAGYCFDATCGGGIRENSEAQKDQAAAEIVGQNTATGTDFVSGVYWVRGPGDQNKQDDGAYQGVLIPPYENPKQWFDDQVNQGTSKIPQAASQSDPVNWMWDQITSLAKSITSNWQMLFIIIMAAVIIAAIAYAAVNFWNPSGWAIGAADVVWAGMLVLFIGTVAFYPTTAASATSGLTNNLPPMPPSTSITSPSSGAYESSTFAFTASASSSIGIYHMALYIDSSLSALASNYYSSSISTTINPYSYASGVHMITAMATDNNGQTTQYSIEITFASSSSGGGGIGGGCVAQNTPILMANGQVRKVQSLKIGDQLEGYDYQYGGTTQVTLTNLTVSRVNELVVINQGFLRLTTTDQPIYIRNSTYTGWVINPINLQVGDQMYNPTANSWVTINSLQDVYGHFKVYDIHASPYDNFIANGVLLDAKAV